MLEVRALARPPMLARLELDAGQGQLVGVLGPNGAGKTTLLRALAGLSAGPGTVRWNGAVVDEMPAGERARRIAFLPAERHIAWPLCVRDLVGLGAPGTDRETAIENALAAADARTFIERRADTLSTGELARVLLARALAGEPELLILDEPVANLDPRHRLAIMDTLAALADRGVTVIASLHDLDLAQRCRRVWLLDRGALVADGSPDNVLDAARLAAVFGVVRDGQGWVRAD